jgi:hypothetical protein
VADPIQKRLLTDAERSGAHDVRARAHGNIAREIVAEIGCAFGRANEKVENAIFLLKLRKKELEADRGPAAIEAFNKQRDVAANALWELRVHREAIGLYDHRSLEQTWGILPDKER